MSYLVTSDFQVYLCFSKGGLSLLSYVLVSNFLIQSFLTCNPLLLFSFLKSCSTLFLVLFCLSSFKCWVHGILTCKISIAQIFSFNPKRAGLFGPISQPGGFHPPKISETDWRNIKCLVLVDSYDPPESIGTKKSTNIPCLTPQWLHKWRHVKNTKITKNRQNYSFSLFFQAFAFFGNDVRQSMLTHVLTPNKPNK